MKSVYSKKILIKEKIRNNIKSKPLTMLLKKVETIHNEITFNFRLPPSFFIIGTQKGGTSSLYDYIAQHPNVKPCSTKEPNYFTKYWNRSTSWYMSFFPFKCSNTITGEASERYFEYPHTPFRISMMFPDAKIIMMLRDPVKRAYSHYNMRKKSNRESLSFNDAVNEENDRIDKMYDRMLDTFCYIDDFFKMGYVRRGLYYYWVKNWLEYFPENQIHVIKSEDFFNDTEKVYHNVLDFLGLDRISLDSYKTVGGLNYKELMDNEIKKQLYDYYKPFNRRLEILLQRRFDWNE